MGDLTGFRELKKIKFNNFHEAYEWGGFVLAKMGACWRLYNKEGYPLTGIAHTIKLGTFGDLECELGASKFECDMSDIVEKDAGLRRMITTMIDKRLKENEVVIQ